MSFSSTGLQATCSRDISPLPHCPPAPFHIQEELDKHVCCKPISVPASCPLSQSREEGHWCNSHFYSMCNFTGTFDTHHVVIPSSNINLPQLVAHTYRGSCNWERQRIQWQAAEHPGPRLWVGYEVQSPREEKA